MQKFATICRWCWRRFMIMLAVIVIFLALLFSGIRLALPYLSSWKTEIENAASAQTGYQVSIESITVSWQGLHPRAHFINTSINDKQNRLFSMGEFIISLDVIETLVNFDIRLHEATVINTRINVSRSKDDIWTVNKLPVSQSERKSKKITIPKKFKNIILSARDSRLVFKDELKKKEYLFDGLSVSASNSGKNFQFYLSSQQPSPLGESFDMGINVNGDINDINSLVGEAYISANQLDTAYLLPWFDNLQPIKQGLLSGKIWFDVGDKKQNFFVEMEAEEIKVDTSKIRDKDFADIKGSFNRLKLTGLFEKSKQNYRIFIPKLEIFDDAAEQTTSFADNLLFSFAQNYDPDAKANQFRVAYDEVSLQVMKKIIAFMPASTFKNNLQKVNLLGAVRQGFIACDSIDKEVSCYGKSRFDKIDYNAGKGKPAFSGFSGDVYYQNNKLYADYHSNNMSVDLPEFFIKPLSLDELSAQVWFDLSESAIMIRDAKAKSENAQMQMEMDLNIKREGDKVDKANSSIKLRANADNILAKNVKYYLPLKKLDSGLSQWLRNGFSEGTANDIRVAVDASFETYKSKTAKVWQVTANAQDVDLKFNPDWPKLKDIYGNFLISNIGFLINADKAMITGMQVDQSYVWINNYNDKTMHADINSKGSLANLLSLVKNSPLKEDKEDFLAGLSVKGQQRSQMGLVIPFTKESKPLVDIELSLYKANIHEKNTDIKVTSIPNGHTLFISESAFTSDAFTASLNGKPAEIAIHSRQNSANNLLYSHIYAETTWPVQEFWPDHVVAEPYWLADIQGEAKFFIDLRLPLNDAGKAKVPAAMRHPNIKLSSNLWGISTSFLAPLKKSKASSNDLTLNLQLLPDKKITGNANIDERFYTEFSTEIDDAGLKIHAAHINLDNFKETSIKDKQGIHIEGYLSQFNLDDWLSYTDKGGDNNEPNVILDSIRTVDLQIDELVYLDRKFIKSNAIIKQDPQYWLINFDHEAIRGDVRLPKDTQQDAYVDMRFDFVNLNQLPEAGNEEQSVDPKEMPLLQASIGHFRVNDLGFNNIKLSTSRALHGIKIDELSVNDPNLNILINGSWINLPDGSTETSLSGRLTTEDLGLGIQNIGYAKLIAGGKGSIDFNFNWPASPVDVSLQNLNGKLQADFEEGDILTIDPGAGRLFSLISLNELPKRLLLDFKDIESKGFYFEKMAGKFSFADGIAKTDKFRIRSTIGKVYLTGDSNMIEQTYDQELQFLPDLSASLPILGTVLGGGNTGIGILVLDGIARIFGKQLDNLGETRYTIKGAWDQPVIEPIVEEVAKPSLSPSQPGIGSPKS